jgi:hypothetical protein
MSPPVNGPQRPGGFAASDLIDPSALPDWVTRRAPAAQMFSSTHGWSAVNPEPDPSLASAEPAFGQGYDQPGYDQGQAPWGADGARDTGAYAQQSGDDQRYGRGQPLAADELPPWLRGSGGAPSAGGRMPQAERNPWASAAEPMDAAGAWEDPEPWDERDGQSEQGWGASGWSDGRDDGQSRQMSAWDASEPSAGWQESAPHHARGGHARGQRRNPDEQRGYADDRYAADERYRDERYPADYDQQYEEYDEEPPDRKRGWLGFLRRDKR